VGGGAGAGSGAGPGEGDGVGEGVGVVPPSAGAAACWIVIACGPTVTVPVRSTGDVFRATVNVTVAERSPFALAGGAIHDTALVIVHAQPVRVSMATRSSPPFAETAVFAGVTVYRQGAASWSTVTCVLLTSRTPRRCTGSALALTR